MLSPQKHFKDSLQGEKVRFTLKNNTLWLLGYGILGMTMIIQKNTLKKIQKKDIDRKAISEEMQMAVLNVHQYLSQNGKISRRIKKINKTLKLHRHTVERIITRGFVQ